MTINQQIWQRFNYTFFVTVWVNRKPEVLLIQYIISKVLYGYYCLMTSDRKSVFVYDRHNKIQSTKCVRKVRGITYVLIWDKEWQGQFPNALWSVKICQIIITLLFCKEQNVYLLLK